MILYELLTGTTPITRESMKKAALDEMLKLIREQDAPTPSSRLSTSESRAERRGQPADGAAEAGAVREGGARLDRDEGALQGAGPAVRDGQRVRRDIERFLNNEAVAAGPPSASYRLRKFVKRNRGQVIAASLVLLALLAGLAGTGFGLMRASVSGACRAPRRSRAEQGPRPTRGSGNARAACLGG